MRQALWLVGVVALLLGAQLALRGLNPYHVQILLFCGINIILAVSLNLVNGFTGQFSIGHAGFMAIGAYAAAMFSLTIGTTWVTALTAAGVPAGLAPAPALLVALLLGGLL